MTHTKTRIRGCATGCLALLLLHATPLQAYSIPAEPPEDFSDIERVVEDEIPDALSAAQCGGWNRNMSVLEEPGRGSVIASTTDVPGRDGRPLDNLLSGMAKRVERGGTEDDGFRFPQTAAGLRTACDPAVKTVMRWVWRDPPGPRDGGRYELVGIENPYFEDPPCAWNEDGNTRDPQDPGLCAQFCKRLNSYTYRDCQVFRKLRDGGWRCAQTPENRGKKYTCTEEWATTPVKRVEYVSSERNTCDEEEEEEEEEEPEEEIEAPKEPTPLTDRPKPPQGTVRPPPPRGSSSRSSRSSRSSSSSSFDDGMTGSSSSSLSGGLIGSSSRSSLSGGLIGSSSTSSLDSGLTGSSSRSSLSGGLIGSSSTSSLDSGLIGDSSSSTSRSGGLTSDESSSFTSRSRMSESSSDDMIFVSSEFSKSSSFTSRSRASDSSLSFQNPVDGDFSSSNRPGPSSSGAFSSFAPPPPDGDFFSSSSLAMASSSVMSFASPIIPVPVPPFFPDPGMNPPGVFGPDPNPSIWPPVTPIIDPMMPVGPGADPFDQGFQSMKPVRSFVAQLLAQVEFSDAWDGIAEPLPPSDGEFPPDEEWWNDNPVAQPMDDGWRDEDLDGWDDDGFVDDDFDGIDDDGWMDRDRDGTDDDGWVDKNRDGKSDDGWLDEDMDGWDDDGFVDEDFDTVDDDGWVDEDRDGMDDDGWWDKDHDGSHDEEDDENGDEWKDENDNGVDDREEWNDENEDGIDDDEQEDEEEEEECEIIEVIREVVTWESSDDDPPGVPNCVPCRGQECRCPGPGCTGFEERYEWDDPAPMPYRGEKTFLSFFRGYTARTERERVQGIVKEGDDRLALTQIPVACYGFYYEFDAKTEATSKNDQHCVIGAELPVDALRDSQSMVGYIAPDPPLFDPPPELPESAIGNGWHQVAGGMSFADEGALADRDGDLTPFLLQPDRKTLQGIIQRLPWEPYALDSFARATDDTVSTNEGQGGGQEENNSMGPFTFVNGQIVQEGADDEGDEGDKNDSRHVVRWLQKLQQDMAEIISPPTVRLRVPLSWIGDRERLTESDGAGSSASGGSSRSSPAFGRPPRSSSVSSFDDDDSSSADSSDDSWDMDEEDASSSAGSSDDGASSGDDYAGEDAEEIPMNESIEMQLSARRDIPGEVIAMARQFFTLVERTINVVVPMGTEQEFQTRAAQWKAWAKSRQSLGLDYPSEVWIIIGKLEDYARQVHRYRALRTQVTDTVARLLGQQDEETTAFTSWMEETIDRYQAFLEERNDRLALAPLIHDVQKEISTFSDVTNLPWCRTDLLTTPIYSLLDGWYPPRPALSAPLACPGQSEMLAFLDGEAGELAALPILCTPAERDFVFDLTHFSSRNAPLEVPVIHPIQVMLAIPVPPGITDPPPPAEAFTLPDLPEVPMLDAGLLAQLQNVVVHSTPEPVEMPPQPDLTGAEEALEQALDILRARRRTYEDFWESITGDGGVPLDYDGNGGEDGNDDDAEDNDDEAGDDSFSDDEEGSDEEGPDGDSGEEEPDGGSDGWEFIDEGNELPAEEGDNGGFFDNFWGRLAGALIMDEDGNWFDDGSGEWTDDGQGGGDEWFNDAIGNGWVEEDWSDGDPENDGGGGGEDWRDDDDNGVDDRDEWNDENEDGIDDDEQEDDGGGGEEDVIQDEDSGGGGEDYGRAIDQTVAPYAGEIGGRLSCRAWGSGRCKHIEMDLRERIVRIVAMPAVLARQQLQIQGTHRMGMDQEDGFDLDRIVTCDPADHVCTPPLRDQEYPQPRGVQFVSPEERTRQGDAFFEELQTLYRRITIDDDGQAVKDPGTDMAPPYELVPEDLLKLFDVPKDDDIKFVPPEK